MADSTKQLLGLISVIIGLIGYAQYLWGIYRKKIKPHVFTWFIWGFSTSIVFYGQLREGGAAGSWVTGLTAFMCIFISLISAKSGDRELKMFDWICLYTALISIVPWQMTNNPVFSVILISIINAVAFMPTFRNAWYHPYHESLCNFFLSAVKFILGIFALSVYNLSTVLYPLSIIIMNLFFVLMITLRRNQLHKKSPHERA